MKIKGMLITSAVIVSALIPRSSVARCDGWDLLDWYYRIPATVTEISGSTLEKITVAAEVDLSDSNGTIKNDGEDIRVIDSGAELNHWTDFLSDERYVSYFFIDRLSADEAKNIYIYYGNSDAAQTGDISSTFLNASDFEDQTLAGEPITPWSVAAGTFTVREKWLGNYAAASEGEGSPGELILENDIPFPYTVGGTILPVMGFDSSPGLIFAWQDVENFDAAIIDRRGRQISWLKMRGGVVTVPTAVGYGIEMGEAHAIEAKVANGSVSIFVDGDAVMAFNSVDLLTPASPQVGFTYDDNVLLQTAFFDNLRIRTYVATEPVVTVGAEEARDCDGDSIADVSDGDFDNDGIPNTTDVFPYDSTEWSDADGDGMGDNADTDDDNDGIPDNEDMTPVPSAESPGGDDDGNAGASASDYTIEGGGCSLIP